MGSGHELPDQGADWPGVDRLIAEYTSQRGYSAEVLAKTNKLSVQPEILRREPGSDRVT